MDCFGRPAQRAVFENRLGGTGRAGSHCGPARRGANAARLDCGRGAGAHGRPARAFVGGQGAAFSAVAAGAAALGSLLTSAALLGVDTCAIEGFSPADYDRILGLENSDYQSCVVCACGYRSTDDKYASLAKVRYSASDLIEHR